MSGMPLSYLRAGDFSESSRTRSINKFYSSLSTVSQPKPQYRSFNSVLANLLMQDHIKNLRAEQQKQRLAGLPLFIDAPRPKITPMMSEQKTNDQLHISVPQIDSPHLHANHVAIRKIANLDKLEQKPVETLLIPVDEGQIDQAALAGTLAQALTGLGSKNKDVPTNTSALLEAHAFKKTPLTQVHTVHKSDNEQSSHLI